jgi:hypothetical protein
MDFTDPKGTIIRNVTTNDVLVLVSRIPTNGYLDVIDVRSGKEGWVDQDDVQIQLTRQPERAAQFTEEYVGSDDPPEVSVENATDSELNLKIEESFYTVGRNATQTIPLSGGTYSYYATEPGAIPAMGKQNFKRGYRYTWKFWIETSYVRTP